MKHSDNTLVAVLSVMDNMAEELTKCVDCHSMTVLPKTVDDYRRDLLLVRRISAEATHCLYDHTHSDEVLDNLMAKVPADYIAAKEPLKQEEVTEYLWEKCEVLPATVEIRVWNPAR